MSEANAKQSKNGGFQQAKEGWLLICASYPNLSGATYAVAIALSRYFNSKTREAWPAIERLATDTNRNCSTVWRALQTLESLALIEVVHGRGRKTSNRYRMKLGHLETDPMTLKRRTSPRGKILRARKDNPADLQQKDCEPTGRTS
ncbi:hypothetical protein RHPLAN_66400 [Rhodoplanes sp. Z2-YC6860]|nr:hypothetical protein RHPLAN_66400 [Rhodoplanes sp. Z2-YC6860]